MAKFQTFFKELDLCIKKSSGLKISHPGTVGIKWTVTLTWKSASRTENGNMVCRHELQRAACVMDTVASHFYPNINCIAF